MWRIQEQFPWCVRENTRQTEDSHLGTEQENSQYHKTILKVYEEYKGLRNTALRPIPPLLIPNSHPTTATQFDLEQTGRYG